MGNTLFDAARQEIAADNKPVVVITDLYHIFATLASLHVALRYTSDKPRTQAFLINQIRELEKEFEGYPACQELFEEGWDNTIDWMQDEGN